ncbi:MAG: hypothetical protein KBD67_07280, partial [Anaerolineaceae bacterium]|nr:hypothetical protein [Anaerolineaceae bacterium]
EGLRKSLVDHFSFNNTNYHYNTTYGSAIPSRDCASFWWITFPLTTQTIITTQPMVQLSHRGTAQASDL